MSVLDRLGDLWSFFSKPSVYFHIDEVARDSIVASGLKAELKRRGVHLVYGNRNVSSSFKRVRCPNAFDVCVFPSVDIYRTRCVEPESIHARIVILPSESVGGTNPNIHRLAAKFLGSFPKENKRWFPKVSRFCAWGSSHKRPFEEFEPELMKNFRVTGHPRMDNNCFRKQKPEREKKKTRIGFLTRFGSINDFGGRHFLFFVFAGRKHFFNDPEKQQVKFALEPNKDIEDVLYKDIADFRLMIDLIFALAGDDRELVVRVHPRENRLTWEYFIKEHDLPVTLAPWDEPMSKWVSSVDYVIGPTSTSFYDCLLAGKHPICTNKLIPLRANHILEGDDDQNEIISYAHHPETIDEIKAIVSTPNPEPINVDQFEGLRELLKLEAGYPECFRSHAAIADVLEETIHFEAPKPTIQDKLFFLFFNWYSTLRGSMRTRNVGEQGSTFILTFARLTWLDRLIDQ